MITFLSSIAYLQAEPKIITLGGSTGWTDIKNESGVSRGVGRFGYTSIELAKNIRKNNEQTDLLIDFDDIEKLADLTKNYDIIDNRFMKASKPYMGKGTGLTRGSGGLILHGKPESLFGKSGYLGSFTIEFWLRPSIAENGEIVFSWRSSRNVDDYPMYQMISAGFFGNHLEWDFTNLFAGYTQDKGEITLRSYRTIIPNKWSFYQITFDESTGLLEFKIDGQTEALKYITNTGKQSGSICSPLMGVSADIEICPQFTGQIDDFRILRCYAENVPKDEIVDSFYGYEMYPIQAGRFESKPLAVCEGSVLNCLDAIYSMPQETDIRFFVRAGDNYFPWTEQEPKWQVVKPGQKLSGLVGKYFQVAVELYTDGSKVKTPSVTEITLTYEEQKPPAPPFSIIAKAGNKEVTLSWSYAADNTTGGYYVYYGTRPGEYLGRTAVEGVSPIDVALATNVTLTGLENGKIYYFAVSGYSKVDSSINGALSAEVWARPHQEL